MSPTDVMQRRLSCACMGSRKLPNCQRVFSETNNFQTLQSPTRLNFSIEIYRLKKYFSPPPVSRMQRKSCGWKWAWSPRWGRRGTDSPRRQRRRRNCSPRCCRPRRTPLLTICMLSSSLKSQHFADPSAPELLSISNSRANFCCQSSPSIVMKFSMYVR